MEKTPSKAMTSPYTGSPLDIRRKLWGSARHSFRAHRPPHNWIKIDQLFKQTCAESFSTPCLAISMFAYPPPTAYKSDNRLYLILLWTSLFFNAG
ncbi:hypothetical protein T439DRAFT_143121 [Meredithblackwellia eburnea MCA 4105]